MSITTKEGILKVLTAYNPWWKTGLVNPKMSKIYKRFAFLYLLGNAEKHGYRGIE